MLKALVRTVGVFGTIFAAGFVAQKYFGWDAKGLLNQAKGKLNALGESTDLHRDIKDASSTSTRKAV